MQLRHLLLGMPLITNYCTPDPFGIPSINRNFRILPNFFTATRSNLDWETQASGWSRASCQPIATLITISLPQLVGLPLYWPAAVPIFEKRCSVHRWHTNDIRIAWLLLLFCTSALAELVTMWNRAMLFESFKQLQSGVVDSSKAWPLCLHRSKAGWKLSLPGKLRPTWLGNLKLKAKASNTVERFDYCNTKQKPFGNMGP